MNEFSNRPQFSRSPMFAWSAVAFIAFCLCAYLTTNKWFMFAALICWIVGALVDRQAKSVFNEQCAEFKNANAINNPAVLDQNPPQQLDSIVGELVDLYDLETGLLIGTGMKRDIQTLFDAFDHDPLVFENGPNDIPMTQDFIEQINGSDKFELTPDFLNLMKSAMDEKYLTLLTIRWMQPKNAR